MGIYLITLLVTFISSALGTLGLKTLATQASPFFGTFVRHSLSSLVLIGVCLIRKSRFYTLFSSIPWPLFKGACARTLLPSVLSNWALQSLSATKYALFMRASPFISALLARILINEKITPLQSIGIAFGCASVIPLFAGKAHPEALLNTLLPVSLPEIALLIIVTSLCYGWIEMKKLIAQKPELSTFDIQVYDFIIGAIGSGMGMLFFEKEWFIGPCSFEQFIATSLGCVILLTMIGNVLYAWHITRLSPIFLSLASLSVPFFTALLSKLLWHEPLGYELITSSLIAFGGALLFLVGKEKTDSL